MKNHEEKVKAKLTDLLSSIDMSGYDPRIHGDHDANVAEHLIQHNVTIVDDEAIVISSNDALRRILIDGMKAYLDYLDEMDARGLINTVGRCSFLADYIQTHSQSKKTMKRDRDNYIVCKANSEDCSINMIGPYKSLDDAHECLTREFSEAVELTEGIIDNYEHSYDKFEVHFQDGRVYHGCIRNLKESK